LTSAATKEKGGLFGGLSSWLDVMPHPEPVIEFAPNQIAVVRWKGGQVESHASESLEAGALMPSPVETNITQPDAVRRALQRALARVGNLSGPAAVLVPDPVVRVFILPFDDLPRRADEALPLLRWRLKKSVPFDVDETAVSWLKQTARNGSLEVVAAVARQSVVREYEALVEGFGVQPIVVLSSTLASLPLVGETGSTLLMRLSGRTLTTAVVRESTLCLYRSTEMPAGANELDPKWVLEEIFPATAYYQDVWGGAIDRALLSGFQGRHELFEKAIENDLKIATRELSAGEGASGLHQSALGLMKQGFDPLVGWMANAGA
jgi:type IV pilus assembly protein PilM